MSQRLAPRTHAVQRSRSTRAALALTGVLLLVPNPALATTPEQLENERLAFGGVPTGPNQIGGVNVGPLDAAPSVLTTSGMLDSPYYKSTVDNNWYPMTYNGSSPATIPLSFGLGVGRNDSATTFHKNTFVAVSQVSNSRTAGGSDDSAITGTGVTLVNRSGDPLGDNNAFTVSRTSGTAGRGTGTITAEGYLKFGADGAARTLKVTHAYTLAADQNFLTAVTTFQNMSASTAENINFWVGTSDDWLGLAYGEGDNSYNADSPSQRKGLIQGNAFRAVCEGPTNAVITFNEREYTLLYSNESSAKGLLTDEIENFNSSVNDSEFTNTSDDPYASIIDLDPATTEDEILEADSAYGITFAVGDLAAASTAGDTKSVTWFIEGGSLGFTTEDCNAAAAGPGPRLECTPDPVAVGGTLTFTITGADADHEFLRDVRAGDTSLGQAPARVGPDGTGTFTYVVPTAARGLPLTVELVEWDESCTVTVATTVRPTRVSAGEGRSVPIGGMAALVALFGVMAVSRLRPRSER